MSDVVLVGIIAAIPGVLASGVGIVNALKLVQIHVSINSRMDQLLSAAREEGIQSERDRSDNG